MVDYSTLSIVFTGLSISIAAFYYIMTLRNTQRNQQLQLETRQVQLFMSIYNGWDEKLSNALYEIMSWEWEDFDDFWEKYGWMHNREKYTAYVSPLTIYFEGLGVLIKEGHLDIRYVALLISGVTRMFWEKIGPFVLEAREKFGNPAYMSETEYLYIKLIQYLEENPNIHGVIEG